MWGPLLPITLHNAVVSAVTTTDAFGLNYLDNVSIHVIWSGGSGTPAGDLFIEGSIDGVTYQVFDIRPTLSISGNSGNHDFNLNQVPCAWLRVRWQRTSGTITLKVLVVAKKI